MSKSLSLHPYKKTIKFLLKQQIEIKVLIVFLSIFCVGLLKIGQVCIPTFQSGKFAFDHYTLPLLISSLVVLYVSRNNWRQIMLLFLFLVISVYLHFNFKSWAPIVNPNNYDVELQNIDNLLVFPTLLRNMRFGLYNSFPFDLNFLYHNLFVMNFFVINFMMACKGVESLRSLNLAIALVLLLGGVLYWAFPASGPFVFIDNPYFEVNHLQSVMLDTYQKIKNTGIITDGFFVSGLAAMPSLHLAHATVFLIYSMSLNAYFKFLFVLSWAVFFIDSMALGWHYFIDIPVGVLLGVAASKFSQRQFKLV